jgi:uncharacterized protein YegP (UPF0339 family)
MIEEEEVTSETKIHLYRDRQGGHRWRLRDPDNGNIIAASTEGYENKSDAVNNIMRIQWLMGLPVRITEGDQ